MSRRSSRPSGLSRAPPRPRELAPPSAASSRRTPSCSRPTRRPRLRGWTAIRLGRWTGGRFCRHRALGRSRLHHGPLYDRRRRRDAAHGRYFTVSEAAGRRKLALDPRPWHRRPARPPPSAAISPPVLALLLGRPSGAQRFRKRSGAAEARLASPPSPSTPAPPAPLPRRRRPADAGRPAARLVGAARLGADPRRRAGPDRNRPARWSPPRTPATSLTPTGRRAGRRTGARPPAIMSESGSAARRRLEADRRQYDRRPAAASAAAGPLSFCETRRSVRRKRRARASGYLPPIVPTGRPAWNRRDAAPKSPARRRS